MPNAGIEVRSVAELYRRAAAELRAEVAIGGDTEGPESRAGVADSLELFAQIREFHDRAVSHPGGTE